MCVVYWSTWKLKYVLSVVKSLYLVVVTTNALVVEQSQKNIFVLVGQRFGSSQKDVLNVNLQAQITEIGGEVSTLKRGI